ncbi:MAG: tRNA (guanosine(37)-N1)-methyltransferase TrmD, partial [Kiritimatiellae bacterium]|nr:tRNA (guanosine(37)-N1)-methyltransferase TrmD [Kiritimatiellia bacterium]
GRVEAVFAIDVISVQPKMLSGFLTESIVARAVKKRACEIGIGDLREFGRGRWRKVDDRPYGGGPGMLMCCEPWFDAVEHCASRRAAVAAPRRRVVMTDPKGRRFSQRDAEAFAAMAAEGDLHMVFMCGHYEGFDARCEALATDRFSVGDFVMTGGELAAAAMVDAIVRLLPGVLGGGPAATADESFGPDGLLEAPQYTRPPEFRGMRVPDVLLSGDHLRIEAWRRAAARRITEEAASNMV